jgi:hypothetical protein
LVRCPRVFEGGFEVCDVEESVVKAAIETRTLKQAMQAKD